MGCFVAAWIAALLVSTFLLLAPGVGILGLLPTVAMAILTYVILKSGRADDQQPSTAAPVSANAVPQRVIDLAGLDSVRTRIKGSSHVASDADRIRHGGTEYLLVRERGNQHDANAIAVYGRGRKVGYLSAARAASTAPLLDQLDAHAFRVTGTGVSTNSIMLWVDAPKILELRRFVRERSARG